MQRIIRGLGFGIGLAALSACQSLPAVPTTIFSGAEPSCPILEPGPSPYTPPFPAECRTMNKTASGVRYIPIRNGDIAGGSPGLDATIVVHYEAFLANSGALIDSSYARGESSVYEMTQLIDGWAEAIQLMNPGDEWLVFVPSAEAFGDQPVGDAIPPNSDLVYRVALEGFLSAAALSAASGGEADPETQPVKPQEVEAAEGGAVDPTVTTMTEEGIVEPLGPDMAAWQAFFPWDGDRERVNTLPSGLSYVALERGPTDVRTAIESDQVLVHYEGRLAETSEFFDSSWANEEPALFGVDALIPGITEALTLMRPGDRFLVHIPSDLAYGAAGAGDAVPPNADLMFQLVLLQIQPSE